MNRNCNCANCRPRRIYIHIRAVSKARFKRMKASLPKYRQIVPVSAVV